MQLNLFQSFCVSCFTVDGKTRKLNTCIIFILRACLYGVELPGRASLIYDILTLTFNSNLTYNLAMTCFVCVDSEVVEMSLKLKRERGKHVGNSCEYYKVQKFSFHCP